MGAVGRVATSDKAVSIKGEAQSQGQVVSVQAEMVSHV